MAYSLTHFLIAFIAVSLILNYPKNKNDFPKHYLLFILIGALLPDLDILIYFILNNFGYSFYEVHRTFSHTIFIPLIFLLFGFIIRKRNKILSNIAMILSISIFSHLILDILIAGKMQIFYPFYSLKIGLDLIKIFPDYMHDLILPIIDTIALIIALIWIELKRTKIKSQKPF